jgi:hypothetical protein
MARKNLPIMRPMVHCMSPSPARSRRREMTAISCFRYATAGDGDTGQTGQFICFKTGQLYLLTTQENFTGGKNLRQSG